MSETKLSKTQKKNLKKRGKKTNAAQLREDVYSYLATKMDPARAQQMTDDFATDGALSSAQKLQQFIESDNQITIRMCNRKYHEDLEDALVYAVRQQSLCANAHVAALSAVVSIDDPTNVVTHPSPFETEIAQSSVLKSDESAETGFTQTTSERGEAKVPARSRGAQKYSLKQQVLDSTHKPIETKQGWVASYETAVVQIQQEFDLKIPLEMYAEEMCRLGQQMLARQLAVKTAAILKHRETRAKYKAMKKMKS